MKSIKELMGSAHTSFSQQIVDTKLCPHGIETLELRETTVIKKDGEKTVSHQWTECLCDTIEEVVMKKKELKIKKFNEYTTQNRDLEHATLANFKLEDDRSQYTALEKAIDYVESFHPESGKKLLLYGDVGIGKSHLAIGIHKEVQANGYTSIYLEMDKVIRAIKDTWDRTNDLRESEFLNVLAEVDLLVLDDLGAEHTNEWFQEKLFSILNSRMGKCTIITTNLDPTQIDKTYSNRISDRLFDRIDAEDCIRIDVKTSYRKKKLLQDLLQKEIKE